LPGQGCAAMSAPKIGLLHPGRQHSLQTALALQNAGALAWYATTIFYDPEKWPYRIERYLPPPLAEKASGTFRRRYEPRLDPALVRHCGRWGWVAGAAVRYLRGPTVSRVERHTNRDFGRSVIRLLDSEPVDIVWAYDTGALEVFRWAKRRGLYCILDRVIAHSITSNAVMAAEYARHPQFFPAPFAPKPVRQLDEEQEEIDLADAIVVGSQYCANTLIANGCPAGKIRVIGYGYDERTFPADFPARDAPQRRPVEFLFAGSIGPRKGVAHLLNAFAEIAPERAALTLLGTLNIPPRTFDQFAEHVRHVPQVSRSEVARYLSAADCFVFPSLHEGSALVLREIYGAGLGGVHTRPAGSGVVAGRNGIILEEASVAGVVEAIERILRDPDCLGRWQAESWAMRNDCTWSVYRRNISAFLDSIVVTHSERAISGALAVAASGGSGVP
jgi:glycosyltransferase involved in cell wall biosynthesis